MEKSADTVLCTCWGVVLDETEAGRGQHCKEDCEGHIPLAFSSVHVDNGLARFDVSKPSSVVMHILVSDIWQESPDVNVGNAFGILKTFCKA